TEPGVYERNLVASTGCDSVVVTNLSVEQLAVHTINLEAGWNIISSYLIPDNQDMVAVVESLIADGNLVKIQDESNNTLEQKNKNTGWVNSIGDFRETEGYKIQVNTSCALEVKGEKVNLPLHVSLTSGWNLISFPVDGNVNAMEVIQPLIDAGVLNKVQDEKGNSIENWRN